MFILAIEGQEDEGAYSVLDDDGEQSVFFWEEEDDALRYAILLEAEDYPAMAVVEVDADTAIKTCDAYNYSYAIITKNDFVIPPRDDNFQQNSIS
tara:strand:- start:3385 stop:3669 length:285 start_codon:yes stop_codon:yes gene_type:complete